MTLKTSLIITGDSSVAQRAVDDLAKAVDRAGASNKSTATTAEQLGAAQDKATSAAQDMAAAIRATELELADVARQSRQAATAAAQLKAAQEQVVGSAQQEAAATEQTGSSLGRLIARFRELLTARGSATSGTRKAISDLKDATEAANDNEDAARRNQYGLRNLGQQFGDFAVQVQGGTSVARAFSSQAGQMGYALSEMTGKLGAVGRFLTGPWGIALTIGLTTLAPFIEKLFEGGKAAQEQADKLAKAADAADSYGSAQTLLGKVVDLTTGKLKTQNAVLLQTIRLQAQANILAAQKDQKDAVKKVTGIGAPTFLEGLTDTAVGGPSYGGAGGQGDQIAANLSARAKALGPLKSILSQYADLTRIPGASQEALDKGLAATIKAIDALGASGKLAGRDLIDTKAAVLALATTLNDQKANQQILDVLDGGALPADLKPYKTPAKPKKPKKPQVDHTTPREAEDIQRINEQFDETPTLVDRAAQATRRLDAIIADLSRRKPPGFAQLIADAQQAKGVIQEGLNKPLDDFLSQQREQLRVGALVNQGHLVEADSLRAILSIEKQRGPLSDQQKAAILASTAALHAQEDQLERIRQKQQVNLNALQDMASIIKQSIYEGPQSLANLPGRLLDAFKRYQADAIFDKYFGDVFQQLKNQVTGADKVEQASNQVATSFGAASSAAVDLSSALKAAAQSATSSPAASGIAATGAIVPGVTTLPDQNELAETIADALGSDIVITALRPKSQPAQRKAPSDFFGDSIAKMLHQGIGISDDAASTIGKVAGKGLSGAFEGQAAAGIASLVGIKTNSTGAALGGAIGNFLPIPGGSIIGGLLGGVLGGLFGPKAHPGGASIGVSANGEAGVTGNVGSDKQGIAAGNSLGGQVASSINDIVQQLGGTLGAFNVEIGKYKDDLRVNVNGRALGGVKGSGASSFGDDENAAINFAVQQAIGQGAIQGVSDAVAKALRSSSDINQALSEALKVQDVELSIGGIGAQIDKAFKDFEATAKDRVRIAQQYGLDVVAVEKKNAEDRVALENQLLQQQVGGLQNLVDEITGGSLFEGSAIDKIKALDTQITKAQADLANGVDGAADTLAGLYEQQLAASKDAYGTTSGYADDRNTVLSEAQAAIAAANQRIKDAEAKQGSDPALATTNAALNENNDQNAQIIANLKQNSTLLGQLLSAAQSGGFNVARLSQLAAV